MSRRNHNNLFLCPECDKMYIIKLNGDCEATYDCPYCHRVKTKVLETYINTVCNNCANYISYIGYNCDIPREYCSQKHFCEESPYYCKKPTDEFYENIKDNSDYKCPDYILIQVAEKRNAINKGDQNV
jgi:ribosomal protein L37AE/L43A